MGILDPGGGYQKFALALSGAGLLLTLACGTSAVPVEPTARDLMPDEPSARVIAPQDAATAGNEVPREAPASDAEIASDAKNEHNLPDSTPIEAVVPEVPAESTDGESISVSQTIGNDVGERIPDFAITLVDGSTVTSAELLDQKQPTFLFFFETW